jgi:hypothetical protein
VIAGLSIGPNFGIEKLSIGRQIPTLPSLFTNAAGLCLVMPACGTEQTIDAVAGPSAVKLTLPRQVQDLSS